MSNELSMLRRLPTVAEYYKKFYNSNVDLTEQPSQCCPFHNEKTPSFKYRVEKDRWTCFGKCHASGDVVDMHLRKFNIPNREQAEKHLKAMCGVVETRPTKLIKPVVVVNESKVEDEEVYQKCLLLADRPDRWIELDYVMSKFPVDVSELTQLLNKWSEEVVL